MAASPVEIQAAADRKCLARGAKTLDGRAKLPPFELVSAAAFASEYEPFEYVWDGIAVRGFLYAWTARTGHGKTAVALTVSLHVTLGREICGRRTEQGPVVYVASENPEDVRVRFMALCERFGCTPEDLDGRLHFLTRSFVLSESIAHLSEILEAVAPVLIVVDTDQAIAGASDDNDNAERMEHAKTLRRLTRLKSRPCVIDLCHPSNAATRGSMRPRGGSSFLNEIDGNAGLWMDDGQSITELFRTSKYRGPMFDDLGFELEEVSSAAVLDRAGRPLQTVIAVPLAHSRESEIRDRAAEHRLHLLRDIASTPRDSVRARAQRTAVSKSQVSNIVALLLAEKLIERDEIDDQSFRLTSKGKNIVPRHSGKGAL